ncbi:MAG: 3'-5' exonuclease [Zoogloea sp.]|uniref:3'-5' exonuclease n=1 Tax=Zoogloea sp. TaxID=49181 RepID=UPI002603C032|nr:3'-5' exonuclease [Zoogloea sp.]MDD3329419.1 3'-5' exonuclease [Zoogloea sp.]
MNWLSRFLPGSGPGLSPDQQASLDLAGSLPAPDLARSHYETRYVVVNTETGPADGAQRLLAVGAVAINRGLIHADDAWQARLGDKPADALIGLLRFIARAPVVVFNSPFNRGVLERAFEQHLGTLPALEWLDLMVLLPSLYPERIGGQARMDAWLGAFGVDRLDHRDALLEALAVAQLHQVALARARSQGLISPQDLLDTQSSRKWLRGG